MAKFMSGRAEKQIYCLLFIGVLGRVNCSGHYAPITYVMLELGSKIDEIHSLRTRRVNNLDLDFADKGE